MGTVPEHFEVLGIHEQVAAALQFGYPVDLARNVVGASAACTDDFDLHAVRLDIVGGRQKIVDRFHGLFGSQIEVLGVNSIALVTHDSVKPQAGCVFDCPCKRDCCLAGPHAVAAAAAAVLLLWVGASEMSQRSVGEPTLRGPAAATPLGVISPIDGSATDPESLVFQWRAAGEAAHYVFTLTDASGDVVFTNGQPDTTLVLPRSVGLDPGAQYFWVVDALLDGARSTSTEFQGFVVERR